MPEHTTIKWLGNSCFLATGREGIRVLIDPFSRRWALEDRYGLREPRIPADIVLVTHEDSDHNALDIVPGSFFVVRGNILAPAYGNQCLPPGDNGIVWPPSAATQCPSAGVRR